MFTVPFSSELLSPFAQRSLASLYRSLPFQIPVGKSKLKIESNFHENFKHLKMHLSRLFVRNTHNGIQFRQHELKTTDINHNNKIKNVSKDIISHQLFSHRFNRFLFFILCYSHIFELCFQLKINFIAMTRGGVFLKTKKDRTREPFTYIPSPGYIL